MARSRVQTTNFTFIFIMAWFQAYGAYGRRKLSLIGKKQMKLRQWSNILISLNSVEKIYLLKRVCCTTKSNVVSPLLKLKHVKSKTLFTS